MQIDIPIAKAEKLERLAAAAGFDSAEQYVTEFVLTLAEQPDAAKHFAPLTEDELAASLAMTDRGMEQIRYGQGLSVEQARRESLEQLGRSSE